ncbi:MAG: hypothetical protein ACOX7F_05955 [Eubacteriales bacterium]
MRKAAVAAFLFLYKINKNGKIPWENAKKQCKVEPILTKQTKSKE